MLKIIGLLLSVFLVSLGIWGILNPHPAAIQVAEIQGSRVNPNSLFRSEQNVLGGGDFATFIPGAFVAVRFARPHAFTRIRHVYPFTQYAFPWVQVKTADIQWSDDGSNWEVADAATAFGGTMDFQVAAAGVHKWWRLVVTGWAGLPDLLIGNIWFDPADAPLVLPYDVAWGLVFAGILGFLTAFSVLTAARAWALLGATAMAFVFNYALRLSPYQIISTNDSPSYLQPLLFGSYDSLRSLGYPNLVRLVGITLGLDNLGNFQLLIQLLSFGVLSFVIWRCYGFLTAVLTLAVGAVFFSGWMVFFAPQILIESMTTSALLLAAAGLIATSRHPTTGGFVLAGVGLALATLAKSTGLALTIAAIPIIRFLPRGQRTYGLMFMIVPALSVYLLMSAHHYARTGLFAPEAIGGTNLAGHVGWMLQGDFPEYPGLIERLNAAVAPSFAGRSPSTLRISNLSELNDYVDYTTQLEIALLLESILPELRKYNPNFGSVEMNSVLTRIAVKSIASNPYLYARQVAAHFYGMWRQVGRAWIDLRTGAIGLRSVYELQLNFRTGPLLTLLGAPFTPEKVRDAAHQQARIELASDRLLDYLSYMSSAWAVKSSLADWGAFRSILSVGLGLISLVLCAAIFVPGHFAFAYRAEIMLAFMLNAYMLAHAMVIGSGVQRFVAPIIPIVFVFAVCFFYSSTQFYFHRHAGQDGDGHSPHST